MYLESIFCLQQKNKEGILLSILESKKGEEELIEEIQINAAKDDFASLYIVSLNRNIFDEKFVSDNDFKLNAIAEIISIMSNGEGNTRFQNQVINYLMQVKDKDFLMYVLENLLCRQDYFDVKNLRVFISTLSSNFKSPKLDAKEKEKLKSIIYKYFLNTKLEVQEALVRMLEVLKIVDLYKTAELFNKAEEPIKKKLMEAIKKNVSFEMLSEIMDNLNMTNEDSDIDENNVVLLIILIDKYKLDETISDAIKLKEKGFIYGYVKNKIRQFMVEKLIDESRFTKLLELRLD